MNDPRSLEFQSLRETIRSRGSLRAVLCWASIVAWAALAVTVGAMGPAPLAWMLPLVALAAGFETVYSLHVGIERVGRYLQVFYESQSPGDGPGWETAAMEYGRLFPRRGPDPLAAEIFLMAGFFNLLGLFISRLSRVEAAVLAVPHVIFYLRVLMLRRRAAAQRAEDLERFTKLKNGLVPKPQPPIPDPRSLL